MNACRRVQTEPHEVDLRARSLLWRAWCGGWQPPSHYNSYNCVQFREEAPPARLPLLVQPTAQQNLKG